MLAGSSSRGWLEPAHDSAMWLKQIRTGYSNIETNIQNFLVAGYVSKKKTEKPFLSN